MRHRLLTAALLLPFLVGCGGAGVISGTVSFDGEPVEDGHISFIPERGAGKTDGSPIHGGKYEVRGLPPGNYRVEVIGNRLVDWPKDTPPAQKTSDKTKVGDLIPPDAPGNRRVVEVTGANQELHFELKKLPKK